jgi:hypothetical protein
MNDELKATFFSSSFTIPRSSISLEPVLCAVAVEEFFEEAFVGE